MKNKQIIATLTGIVYLIQIIGITILIIILTHLILLLVIPIIVLININKIITSIGSILTIQIKIIMMMINQIILCNLFKGFKNKFRINKILIIWIIIKIKYLFNSYILVKITKILINIITVNKIIFKEITF